MKRDVAQQQIRLCVGIIWEMLRQEICLNGYYLILNLASKNISADSLRIDLMDYFKLNMPTDVFLISCLWVTFEFRHLFTFFFILLYGHYLILGLFLYMNKQIKTKHKHIQNSFNSSLFCTHHIQINKFKNEQEKALFFYPEISHLLKIQDSCHGHMMYMITQKYSSTITHPESFNLIPLVIYFYEIFFYNLFFVSFLINS